jgi:sarcosine oxidase subunit alpha
VYATGGYDQNLLFSNNDRPGVFSARAVGRLLTRFRVKPSDRPLVVGDGDYAEALAGALERAGARVSRAPADEVAAAHGHSWVRAVDLKNGKRIKCDLVAACTLPAPASELPRQHGVAVELEPARGGFVCRTDANGRTAVKQVFACGDVTGYLGPAAAAQAGARTGEAIVKSS